MATGSALGQVCRAAGHVTPAGVLITKTTFLFSQSHTGTTSPVLYCFHTFFSHYFFIGVTSEQHVFFPSNCDLFTVTSFKGEMCNCCATSINKMEFQELKQVFRTLPQSFIGQKKQPHPKITLLVEPLQLFRDEVPQSYSTLFGSIIY